MFACSMVITFIASSRVRAVAKAAVETKEVLAAFAHALLARTLRDTIPCDAEESAVCATKRTEHNIIRFEYI